MNVFHHIDEILPLNPRIPKTVQNRLTHHTTHPITESMLRYMTACRFAGFAHFWAQFCCTRTLPAQMCNVMIRWQNHSRESCTEIASIYATECADRVERPLTHTHTLTCTIPVSRQEANSPSAPTCERCRRMPDWLIDGRRDWKHHSEHTHTHKHTDRQTDTHTNADVNRGWVQSYYDLRLDLVVDHCMREWFNYNMDDAMRYASVEEYNVHCFRKESTRTGSADGVGWMDGSWTVNMHTHQHDCVSAWMSKFRLNSHYFCHREFNRKSLIIRAPRRRNFFRI